VIHVFVCLLVFLCCKILIKCVKVITVFMLSSALFSFLKDKINSDDMNKIDFNSCSCE
jgi:hypothetical protein